MSTIFFGKKKKKSRFIKNRSFCVRINYNYFYICINILIYFLFFIFWILLYVVCLYYICIFFSTKGLSGFFGRIFIPVFIFPPWFGWCPLGKPCAISIHARRAFSGRRLWSPSLIHDPILFPPFVRNIITHIYIVTV